MNYYLHLIISHYNRTDGHFVAEKYPAPARVQTQVDPLPQECEEAPQGGCQRGGAQDGHSSQGPRGHAPQETKVRA